MGPLLGGAGRRLQVLEPGLTVAEAKRCAQREVAAGRVNRVEAVR
jgi:hypothetical protein